MTPLARLIAARIASEGPMSLADFMADCLMHPRLGYYATRDPFGTKGDFTTAPEITQMFGEMIGLCLAQVWVDQGSPDPFRLVELGPGRGTLMSDVLRTIRAVPGMSAAARVHLVETSSTLCARQEETLAGTDVEWHDHLGQVPEGPLYLVANEFFDALPIRQFVRAGPGWRERQIGIEGDRLTFGLGPVSPIGPLDSRLADTRNGDIVEICPALPAITTEIAHRIAASGGAALVIDYGGWRSRGDTLQALEAHRFADPLERPGEADLTAHVDFEALATAFRAGGAAATAMTTQGAFLERLGVAVRTQALAARLSGAALAEHLAAHRRLTHPKEMGHLFKVIACHPAGGPPPPGLDP